MTDDLRRAVHAVCDQTGASENDRAQMIYAHLKGQVEDILAGFERDGVVFGRICPRSERGDLAGVVASVLLREAARGHTRRDFAACASCGNPAAAATDERATRSRPDSRASEEAGEADGDPR